MICIFVGAAFAYVLLLTLLGPERKGANLDALNDADSRSVISAHNTDKIEDKENVDVEKSGSMCKESL